MSRIYGKVESVEDIKRINCIIRDEMLKIENEAELTELKKRSDYLCALTYSPFWQKKFKDKIEELREVAIEENRATVKTANYIAKYKGGAKVLWLVYFLPRRKREYAKRIYFPADAFDIKVEGPDYYKNRFGNNVYGIKLTYKMTIKPTTIHIRGKEIHLPERVVSKTKIIPIPQDATDFRIVEEKPASAMDIA